MPNKTLVLDCDGVLLDYNTQFARLYQAFFGAAAIKQAARYYHARAQYHTPLLDDPINFKRFMEYFSAEGWGNMPALPSAVEATQTLHQLGFKLVCVTSMPEAFIDKRRENLVQLGFPINEVIAAPRHYGDPTHLSNPKADIVNKLSPRYFVDDLADNFIGISPNVERILVESDHIDTPNANNRHLANIIVPDLMSFVSTLIYHV